MKTLKNTKAILIIILMSLIMTATIVAGNIQTAKAITNEPIEYDNIAKTYTVSKELHNDAKKNIKNYPKYVSERFKITEYNLADNITDEWILDIIPKVFFDDEVTDYCYMGESYGFYIDYNESDHNYLVYLFLTENNQLMSGHFARKVSPFYYENYYYDKDSGKAKIKFVENDVVNHKGYYEKLSARKKLYIKNMVFSAQLFNENSLNVGDEGYDALKDDGVYLIGNSYKYYGTGLGGGDKFDLELAQALFGVMTNIQEFTPIGIALDIANLIIALGNKIYYETDTTKDKVTNTETFDYNIGEIYRESQITKYGGLLKNSVNKLITSNTKGILYGTDGDYAESTFYYRHADENNIGNTGFAGRVQFDIVEKKSVIGDSGIRHVATVESQSYSTNLTNSQKFELNLDKQTDTYVLTDGSFPAEFTAPYNGNYTISTIGNEKIELQSATGTVKTLEDGKNQALTVDLKKNDKLSFAVKNASTNTLRGRIKTMFTPKAINIGDQATLRAEAGETEYLAYYATGRNAIELNYSCSSNIRFIASENSVVNSITDTINASSLTDGFLTEGGVYYFGFHNLNDSYTDITVNLKAPSRMQLNKVEDIEIQDKRVAEYTADYSGYVNFALQNAVDVSMRIYNAEYDVIGTVNYTDGQALLALEKGQKYYVELTKDGAKTAVTCNAAAYYYRNRVRYNTQNLTKVSDSCLYEFTPAVSGSYNITAGENTIKAYDNNKNELVFANGKIALTADTACYLSVGGSQNSFELSICIAEQGLSGVFTDYGNAIVKFVPNATDKYNVIGIETANWYDNSLRRVNNSLTKDEIYYAEICGVSGNNYNISIERNYKEISLRSGYDLENGLYRFYINESGSYIFNFSKDNTVTASYKLMTGDKLSITSKTLTNDRQKEIAELSAGYYFIEAIVSDEKAISLSINRLNADDKELVTSIGYGVEQSTTLLANLDNNYTFTAPVTGEYCFKIGYSSIYNVLNIDIFNSNLDNVDYVFIEQDSIFNDSIGKRYGIKINLVKDEAYMINIYNSGAVLSSTFLINKYNEVNNIVLRCENEDDVEILKDRNTTETTPNVIMGKNYSPIFSNNDGIKWTISNPVNTIAEKINNKLCLKFDSANENRILNIIIADDKGIITISLMIKFKIYAAYEEDNDIFSFKIKLIDIKGQTIPDNGNFVNMQIEYAGNDYTETTMVFDLKDKLYLKGKTIGCKVTLKYDNNATYEVNVQNIPARAISECKLSELGNGTEISTEYMIIDATTITANKKIIVNNTCKAIYYLGNTQLENIQLEIKNNQEIYLFLGNCKIISTDSKLNALITLNANATIDCQGINTLRGIATDALLLARNSSIVLKGTGTLEIKGNDGVNGINGANGANGMNAYDFELFDRTPENLVKCHGKNGINGSNGTPATTAVICSGCNNISNKLTVSFIGGNGGHGGKGGNGGHGGKGSYANVGKPSPNGGNGGRGGNGGNGGARGLGCNVNVTNITVKNGFDGWGGSAGNGGRGGDGNIGAYAGESLMLRGSSAGHGGNGGDAGIPGSGYKNCMLNTSLTGYGRGGNGGYGGIGAIGLMTQTSNNYLYSEGTNGGNGGHGGAGYYGGNGGNGGNGGKGARGRNAFMITGTDGRRGGNGGNAGNGGNSFSSISNIGSVGSIGIGGPGGDPGTGLFKKYSTGPKGSNGSYGTPGRYIQA